jgi:mono/diheme cytochrome c family protein
MHGRMALLTYVFFLLFLTSGAFGQADDLYQSQCASCHAPDGAPTAAGNRLGAIDLKSRFVQNMTNDELFNSIALADSHKGYAHAFARRGLTDKQINDLVDCIRQMNKVRPLPKRKKHLLG